MRLFLGTFESLIAPSLIAVTQMWWKRNEQTLRTSYWSGMNGLTFIIGSLFTFGLGHIQSSALFSYQIIFLFCGLLTVAYSIPVYFLMPDSPMEAKFLSDREKVVTIERLRSNQMGIVSRQWKWEHVKESILDLKTWCWFFLVITISIPSGGISTFGSLIVKSFGYNNIQTILFNIPFGAVQMCAIIGSGWLATKLGRKGPIIMLLCITPIISVYPGITPLIFAWEAQNTAGDTKRKVTTGVMFVGLCTGNTKSIVTLYLFFLNKSHARRRLALGKSEVIVDRSMLQTSVAAELENNEEMVAHDHDFEDMTDLKNEDFIFIPSSTSDLDAPTDVIYIESRLTQIELFPAVQPCTTSSPASVTINLDYDHDVISLTMSKVGLTGVEDFGRESSQRRSLHLDTVMQGQPRSSTCRLLQLPAEILADIADLLSDDRQSLASLALVNTHCRQLARHRQFAAVIFKYNSRSKRFASKLKSSRGLKPGVSACVRRVTFAANRKDVCRYHRRYAKARAREDPDELSDEQHYATVVQTLRDVQAAAAKALSSMPNLETLVWKDEYSLHKGLFEKIVRCSARHFELDGAVIDDAWSLAPPLTPSTWPLRSLKLDVSLAKYSYERSKLEGEARTHAITVFFSTLFCPCSSTLESLIWSDSEGLEDDGVLLSIGETAMVFPRLKYLRLQYIKLDSVATSSLLGAPLKFLELDEIVLPSRSISNCEPLRDLEDFTVSHPPKSRSACRRIAKFISKHTGLRKLYLQETFEGTKYLDDIILPTLTSYDFGNLASLHIAWGEIRIPSKSLQMIARLGSLEQLSLSAGTPCNLCDGRYFWEVDHNRIRHHLSPLQRLTKLAFSHDVYPCVNGTFQSAFYYPYYLRPKSVEEANARPDFDREGEEVNNQVELLRRFERKHRKRMLHQAEKYAVIFPKLEWMHFATSAQIIWLP
ncbi:allantoate transporter [Fusarium pseudoanthophilum]|uniref:Allantoate transporter n=1 Tax=Fusarium pseudoanthophilum TaxID=48495 RepID=A0A8H5KH58_9HYPO|nr:allantoate transporter [Fusarium pseudoanthophilum]